ncbi:Heat shock protein 70 [Actinomyces bovis]|uniref:Heat shock protein 70 n=1 Tax=Actinomyces bovis TaxID=1658 RepID=A0ABY1VQQ4_9ACTO|nr:Hsp70 family protein [Actinomyces bovis]SPT54002.1 Heat shock protein 70 [Actinomyces bovis]VEG53878.1 Heat shock protein 70 [Actinomyces israelii]
MAERRRNNVSASKKKPNPQSRGLDLGIDLGTTRTVVARADRGNYPVVSFPDSHGDLKEYLPSLTALTDEGLVHGFAAEAAARSGAPYLRSLKRTLASPSVRADTPVEIGGHTTSIMEVLVSYLEHLRFLLEQNPDIGATALQGPDARLTVAVPAHAFSAQRLLTLDAFSRAGFSVTALLNEPSAAGFEFTHRRASQVSANRTQVLVYDLGGGTFDTSLVSVSGKDHRVLATRGVSDLGGDDVDLILAELALRAADTSEESLNAHQLDDLLEQCRDAKEGLSPQTRRLVLEVAGKDVVVATKELYEACQPLIERSLEAMAPLVDLLDDGSPDLSELAGVYLVGGGSCFPPVARALRERFGRRVNRSPYPGASTAIGLAIAADRDSGYELTDQLSRGFGVFREQDFGERTSFDPILREDSLVAGSKTKREGTVVEREYLSAHNIGWFRLAECSSVDASGEPRGELAPYEEIIFPFDPALREVEDLRSVEVRRGDVGSGRLIKERYEVDATGVVRVSLTDTTDSYTRSYALGARTH